MKLTLATKFNLVFICIFTVGYLAAVIVADHLRTENARTWLEAALVQKSHSDAPLNEEVGKPDETVGEQIISVPMEVPLKRADVIYHTFMYSLLVVFALVFVSLNVMVYFFVTRRICELSRLADEVSMGNFDGDDFNTRGCDEVSHLAQSFNRLRTSMARALKMLEETD